MMIGLGRKTNLNGLHRSRIDEFVGIQDCFEPMTSQYTVYVFIVRSISCYR